MNALDRMLQQVQEDQMQQGYNTRLNPQLEQQFQQWKAVNAPHDSGYDYDLRGLFMRVGGKRLPPGHGVDTFKKPNHPTFSDQSRYSLGPMIQGGSWGDHSFTPARTNLEYRSPNQLQQYLNQVENVPPQRGYTVGR